MFIRRIGMLKLIVLRTQETGKDALNAPYMILSSSIGAHREACACNAQYTLVLWSVFGNQSLHNHNLTYSGNAFGGAKTSIQEQAT
jgi:hypothetical protein